LSGVREAELCAAIDRLLALQQQRWLASKEEAIQALCDGFSARVEKLQHELRERETTVSNVARYFEDIVADLTERSRRDPKTKLMNFSWFMERLESFLSVEQRVRYCGIGVVDITAFKWYNDHLGHAVGDRIIERVAGILAEQIRSRDLLAQDKPDGRRDLHARFGGDEFCFLIPDLPGRAVAGLVAGRFKTAVESHDWAKEDPRLAERPVRVDVGVVCLSLGPVSGRRKAARKLASDLIHRADQLMYGAKGSGSVHVYLSDARIEAGQLVEKARRAPRTGAPRPRADA
jgi:diguanylate cyclase (GGDEF)-like protein